MRQWTWGGYRREGREAGVGGLGFKIASLGREGLKEILGDKVKKEVLGGEV